MQDDYFSKPMAAAPAPRSAKPVVGAVLLAFLLGCAVVGWLAWRSGADFGQLLRGRHRPAVTAQVTTDPKPLPAPNQAAPNQAAPNQSAPSLNAPALAGPTDARLASLEQRFTRLDLLAQAAAGNAGRAEGVLVAYAARRAIERGAPLGYLADQLRLRFADAQPNAVETVIAAAQQPVTLADLSAELDSLTPQLTQHVATASGWAAVRREVSQLFVIRHEDHPSPAPESRIERAHLLLTGGRIDRAIAEVSNLPGATSAQSWIAAARRYDGAMRALDLLETTAILDPRRLRDSSGTAVQQPSPMAGPGDVAY